MSVHSQLKSSQIYKKQFFYTHGDLGGVCDYCLVGIHSSKILSTHSLTTHGLPVLRDASADLATKTAAADVALGDVRTAGGDDISGTSLQKSESAFLLFLRHIWSAETNQRMKISR